MEEKIYALLRLGDGAAEKLDRLSKRMQKIASYAFGDTRMQMQAILKITEKKRRLENALYYREKLLAGLTEEETALLLLRAHGVSSEKAKEGSGYSARSVRRKTVAAEKTAANILYLLGYDAI